LKKLQAERTAALAKKKDLDDAQAKTLSTEAEIARLEEELARLKGETVPGAPLPPGEPAAVSPPPAPGRTGP
jgi:outer membrane protein TolC